LGKNQFPDNAISFTVGLQLGLVKLDRIYSLTEIAERCAATAFRSFQPLIKKINRICADTLLAAYVAAAVNTMQT